MSFILFLYMMLIMKKLNYLFQSYAIVHIFVVNFSQIVRTLICIKDMNNFHFQIPIQKWFYLCLISDTFVLMTPMMLRGVNVNYHMFCMKYGPIMGVEVLCYK